MQALIEGDLAGFMETEAEIRRPGGWPPYGRLAALIISADSAQAADELARDVGRAAPRGEGLTVLGPAPAPFAILRGRHRRRLLLKTRRDVAVQPILRHWLAQWRLQVVGVKDAAHHAKYVPDVTAWEYRYAGESNEDKGHDTKVDPAKAQGGNAGESSKGDSGGGAAPKAGSEPDATATGRLSRGNEEAGESASTLKPNTPGLLLTMEDIVTKLPRRELVTQFKCIEGWSQIVHWAGVRMADFLELYPPAPIDGREPRYVYMETPDGDYYCGFDTSVMRHPQTLLATEMMGAPLTQNHGAPLRLHMPTKYGYKQIKRIGLIAYTNGRPDDYWTKLGYDWYAGL